MAEIQYYDWKFTSEEGNIVYHNIINCDIVKPPYFNNSFRTKFIQSANEDWDKNQYFLRKRQGFKRVPFYNWNSAEDEMSAETDDERLQWIFKDVIIIDWYRYFMLVNSLETKMRIYKQIDINDLSPCSYACYSGITEWHIVNIVKYWDKDYFPIDKCNHMKFLVTTYVKWKAIHQSETWVAMSKKLYDTYFAYLYEEDSTIPTQNGDYVLTHGKNASGLVHVVWKNDQIIDGKNVLWFSTSWAPVMQLNEEKNVIKDVKYKIFRKFWTTFHFVTADGIVHRHYDEGTPSTFEYTFNWDTEFNTNDWANTPNFYIQSMDTFDQATAFLSSEWILFLWKRWYNKFFFSALDTVQTNWMYTDIIEQLWQLTLVWPDGIWYFIYDFNTWVSSLFDLTKRNWHFSKWAYWIKDEKFFFVRKTKDLYTMDVQFGYWSSKPAVVFWYLSNYLNTDLDMLDPKVNKVTLEFQKDNVNIFINDWSGNTKMLFYNRYYNVWSKRLIAGCEIHTVKDEIYLWKWIFENVGTTDNWNDITQIITMVFWDKTHSATKRITSVKLPIGYNSYFVKWKTFFSSSVENGWRHFDTVYDDFWRTDYCSNIMKLQLSNSLFNNIETKIRDYPIEVELYSSKWVNFEADVANSWSEFKEYMEYWKVGSDGNEESKFTISKMWIIRVPLSQIWEVFTFELVAKWETRIEFWWFFVAFDYLDNDYSRLENVMTMPWLTVDSWKSFVETNTHFDSI